MLREVIVRDERVEVEVQKRSGTLWIARGMIMGQLLEVRARSEGAALIAWRDAAKYLGD